MSRRRVIPIAVVIAWPLALVRPGFGAASHEIILGLQCDRTGPTRDIGAHLCPGYHDYIRLVNSRGGVEGHRLRAVEIDNEDRVPAAVEAYARHKKDGAVVISLYGTPQTYVLTHKLTEDRIPGTSPGFGRADATDGARYPYIFPLAASCWSQAAAAVGFAKQQLGGLRSRKLAFVFSDSAAGREPIPLLKELAGREAFQLKTYAVPPPGLEMGAQVLDIRRRYRPDFVITHLMRRSPSVSIKEFKRVGYPLRKVLSLVSGSAEADIEAAGGFGVAEGYYTMQYAGVGPDFPVLDEIRAMYSTEGKEPPRAMASTVSYNRGVMWAAVAAEALRHALTARLDGAITGADVKTGFEKIRGFTLGGLIPPLVITADDHEGGGWVQIWQVKDGKLAKTTDWYTAYRDVVTRHVKEASRQ